MRVQQWKQMTIKNVSFGKFFTNHLTEHRHQQRARQIAFMPVAVDTSDRVYDDFNRLLFLHAHREASALANE